MNSGISKLLSSTEYANLLSSSCEESAWLILFSCSESFSPYTTCFLAFSKSLRFTSCIQSSVMSKAFLIISLSCSDVFSSSRTYTMNFLYLAYSIIPWTHISIIYRSFDSKMISMNLVVPPYCRKWLLLILSPFSMFLIVRMMLYLSSLAYIWSSRIIIDLRMFRLNFESLINL